MWWFSRGWLSDVEDGSGGAGLGVGRGIDEARDARMDHRAGAHRARLDGGVELAAIQAVVVSGGAGLAQSEDLGVGAGIVVHDGAVMGARRRAMPSRDDDAADGNFAQGFGVAREGEGFMHPVFVCDFGLPSEMHGYNKEIERVAVLLDIVGSSRLWSTPRGETVSNAKTTAGSRKKRAESSAARFRACAKKRSTISMKKTILSMGTLLLMAGLAVGQTTSSGSQRQRPPTDRTTSTTQSTPMNGSSQEADPNAGSQYPMHPEILSEHAIDADFGADGIDGIDLFHRAELDFNGYAEPDSARGRMNSTTSTENPSSTTTTTTPPDSTAGTTSTSPNSTSTMSPNSTDTTSPNSTSTHRNLDHRARRPRPANTARPARRAAPAPRRRPAPLRLRGRRAPWARRRDRRPRDRRTPGTATTTPHDDAATTTAAATRRRTPADTTSGAEHRAGCGTDANQNTAPATRRPRPPRTTRARSNQQWQRRCAAADRFAPSPARHAGPRRGGDGLRFAQA